MTERRRTKRFVEKNKASINFTIEKDNIRRDSEQILTGNLSIDGAKLVCHKSFPFDTRLVITLELPKSKQIVKLRARVVWEHYLKGEEQYEVGVEFIHSPQTIANLFQHLYGFDVQPKKKIPSEKEHYVPVEVALA